MTTMTKKYTFTKIVSYQCDNVGVIFTAVTSVPGYSHRVTVVKEGKVIAKDWLGREFFPSTKSATYFLEKHLNEKGT